ncbi:CheY-like chemotaxis protein [Mucilaginibacter sp. UYNi724]
METHRGMKLEFVTGKLGYNVDDLSLKLKVSQRTILKWFKMSDLSAKVINSIGKAIGYDFKSHFPDLYSDNNTPLVYVIDDADLDIIILKHSINRVVNNTKIEVFNNGDDAISRLLHVSINTPEQLSDCIFLDLNMPVSDGWDFILNFQRLNIDPLGRIRTFILTSSLWQADTERSLKIPFIEELIRKPIGLEKIRAIFNLNCY